MRIGHILGGFVLQVIGVFVSINTFSSSGGTIFWWTPSAIAMAAMICTPDKHWPERAAHVVSGMAAYVPFRYDKFAIPLLATVCASNALAQTFGFMSMKRFYPTLTRRDVGTLRFLGIFFLFPVLFASIVASVPGSLGFYYLLGTDVDIYTVMVNYATGHISGTAALLYPLLVVTVASKDCRWLRKTLVMGGISVSVTALLFAFTNYHLLGFATIVAVYGLFVGISAVMDQRDASVVLVASTGAILGLTAAGRGPFVYVNKGDSARAVLIGTQMGITALTAVSAFVVIVVSQLRALEEKEREARCRTEEIAERQTLDLHRIGHDMKNNSTMVRAICDTVLDGGDTFDIATETLKTVSAINTLNNVLVSDMVEMVRGKTENCKDVSRESVDVWELMQTYLTVSVCMTRLDGKEGRVSTSLTSAKNVDDSDDFVVYTNRERLHQVMCNFVSNAVKYTERGDIVLGVDCSDKDTVVMSVADTGIGLSEDDVGKVFDLFYRSKRATTVNSGTGLGLANVKRVCIAIGAQIDVSSPGEGKGSTFSLLLPRMRDDQERDKRQTTVLFSLRVLVVDDSLVIRTLMTKYLNKLGCEVVATSSVEESLRVLSAEDHPVFDVIITDGSMGDVESGPDFIRKIRNGRVVGLPRSAPCILCSGEHYSIGRDDPNTLLVTKPFTSADIAAALAKLTTPPRPSDEVV